MKKRVFVLLAVALLLLGSIGIILIAKRPSDDSPVERSEATGQSESAVQTAQALQPAEPTEAVHPAEASQTGQYDTPILAPVPSETSGVDETPRPAETSTPGEFSQPAVTPKPGETPRPAETPAATDSAKPSASLSPDDPSSFRTMNDAFTCDRLAYAFYEDLFVCVFSADRTWYRAEADMPTDLYARLEHLDPLDEGYSRTVTETVKDLPIRKIVSLSPVLFSQTELDALTGKTGLTLLETGFVPLTGHGFSENATEVYFVKGPFAYRFEFVETVPDREGFDLVQAILSLTVKRAALYGTSEYSLEHDFDLYGGPDLETLDPYSGMETEIIPPTTKAP